MVTARDLRRAGASPLKGVIEGVAQQPPALPGCLARETAVRPRPLATSRRSRHLRWFLFGPPLPAKPPSPGAAAPTAASIMNIFRLTGDLSHLAAIVILLLKIWKTRSCAGERPGEAREAGMRGILALRGPRGPDTPPSAGCAGAWVRVDFPSGMVCRSVGPR